jgi:phosphate transport system permease protein
VNLYFRRRAINAFNLTCAAAGTALGLAVLVWLLWVLFAQGLSHLDLHVFTLKTPAPGSDGGLANAIVGSLFITGTAVAIGTPAGILAGTYLAEFSSNNTAVASTARFVNDILLSAPSIVIGVFVYEIVVVPQGHFSGWAGAIALAIIMIPVVVRTTEDMLRLVPKGLREAAAALGASRWRVVVTIVYRAARGGILTGVMLGTARIAGETAPLLFTALSNQFWSLHMNEPMANLPTVIFNFGMSPYDDWQELAWTGALLITVGVLLLNLVARFVLRNPQKT